MPSIKEDCTRPTDCHELPWLDFSVILVGFCTFSFETLKSHRQHRLCLRSSHRLASPPVDAPTSPDLTSFTTS
eukprot:scaffold177140_cov42-Prasinocladus_malaysianus.AAC.1